eukprot:79266-Rhodomonas_salina.1
MHAGFGLLLRISSSRGVTATSASSASTVTGVPQTLSESSCAVTFPCRARVGIPTGSKVSRYPGTGYPGIRSGSASGAASHQGWGLSEGTENTPFGPGLFSSLRLLVPPGSRNTGYPGTRVPKSMQE